jgi:hypothetical protein
MYKAVHAACACSPETQEAETGSKVEASLGCVVSSRGEGINNQWKNVCIWAKIKLGK